MKKQLFRTIPAITVMVLIFSLSSLRGDQLDVPSFQGLDKIVHAGLYALLARTYLFAMNPDFLASRLRRALFLTWAGAVCYGISDELHQYFVPSRTPDIYDLLADACGALCCVVIYCCFRNNNTPLNRTRL